jgi:hypothetical protein
MLPTLAVWNLLCNIAFFGLLSILKEKQGILSRAHKVYFLVAQASSQTNLALLVSYLGSVSLNSHSILQPWWVGVLSMGADDHRIESYLIKNVLLLSVVNMLQSIVTIAVIVFVFGNYIT